MVEPSNELTYKLLELIQKTGYPIEQHNGQRKFGPPPDWTGPPPPRGSEVFVGKLPREIFEDELVPIFSRAGRIYEMRLMMDFSGSNRGYAFVTYTSKAEAATAVKQMNGYEISPGRNIGVVKSVDNCRLFVGGVPKDKSKQQILEELVKHVDGIVNVILYTNCFDRRQNRGFAFVEFTSHRAAAMARRALVPGCVKLWDRDVMVDWAEPEPEIEEEQMQKVKVLYVRNFLICTTPETIQAVFERAINNKIERVKKIYDYAFIHFYSRAHAELAMNKLQNADVQGVNIEIRWAKPVDRELYRFQKLKKGNAKFNNGLDLSQSLLLYKQHLESKEYANSLKEDEGISSGCAGESPCNSVSDDKVLEYQFEKLSLDHYNMPPAKLDSMCKRYFWAPPAYEFQKCLGTNGTELWVCNLELPLVGTPLLTTPRRIGPLVTRPCLTKQAAHIEAAERALHYIKIIRADLIQRSTPGYSAGACLPAPSPMTSIYPVTPMPACLSFDTFEYPTMYPSMTPTPVHMPSLQPMWRTV